MSMADNPLSADLDQILRRTRPLWEELRGAAHFHHRRDRFFRLLAAGKFRLGQ